MKLKLVLLLVLLVIISGCNATEVQKNLPKTYEEAVKTADATTVNMFMWGGDKNVNDYIDNFVAPKLKEQHNITLKRTPMNANEFIEKIANEKKANKTTGTIDIIWINGENFKRAKEEELLLGGVLSMLPNAQNIPSELKVRDAGVDVDGLEMPWGKVEFAFQYNSKFVKQPPETFQELLALIEQMPGKFTYPEPTDFTGAAFVKMVALNVNEPQDLLNGKLTDDDLQNTYKTLKQLSPNFWKGGKTYPSSLEALDKLYADEEVYFTMGFNANRAIPYVNDGIFPATTKTIVPKEFTIANCHYLSVPFNAPNAEGALVAINYLISAEAQLEKAKPNVWGDGSVIDVLAEESAEITHDAKEVSDLNADADIKIRETWSGAMFE